MPLNCKPAAMFAIPVAIITSIVAIVMGLQSIEPAQAKSVYQSVVDAEGKISLPKVDFRKDWTVLGTWAIDNDKKDGAKGFHTVYAEPGAVAYFRANGKFPDQAVIVKELRNAKTDALTTGTASWPTDLVGWFVMVKDAKGRFATHGLWGDGWGWAFFKASAPEKTATKDYKTECLGCHIPAQKDDWLYLRAYPVLKK